MKTVLLLVLIITGVLCNTLLSSFAIAVTKPCSAKKALKQLDEWCAYVPGGNALLDGDTTSVAAFYMSSTEITNFQYNEFLQHLKKNGETEKYAIAAVDTTKWNTVFKHAHLDAMGTHYHLHPAFRDYPVVNITKAGAELYCEWLTMMYDSLSGGELKLKFRVPTRAEYLRAARGDDHSRVYTWKAVSIFKKDGKSVFYGQMQANCIRNGAECITRNKETGALEYIHADYRAVDFMSDGAFLTAPAKSYWPNELGFYNINGNVAEMIADGDLAAGGSWNSPGYDIRNESVIEFTEAQPTVGFRVVATYIQQ